MFIATGKLDYDVAKKLLALAPADYRSVRTAVQGVFTLPETQEKKALDDACGWNTREAIVTDRIVNALSRVGIEITLSNVRGLENASNETYNTIYQIMVPDIGVLGIRNVTYLYDCEEHEINTQLDRGWRILAVAPPRFRPGRVPEMDTNPTFIIGHTKPPE